MPTEKTSSQSSTFLKIFLIVLFVIIVGGLIFANIKFYPKMAHYFRAKQADLTYEDFIANLQQGKVDEAYKLTSAAFRTNLVKTNASVTGLSAEQLQKLPLQNKNSSSQDLFKAFLSTPSSQVIKNKYTLYQGSALPAKAGAVTVTARFKNDQGREFDMTAQLVKVGNSWQIETLTLPDPTDGGAQ